MRKSLQLLLLSCILSALACSVFPRTKTAGWQLLYQNGLNGQPIAGSRKVLFDAIKTGYPVRVAWGQKFKEGSIVQFAIPEFLTLVNDSILIVQCDLGLDQVNLFNPQRTILNTPPRLWKGLLSTDGSFYSYLYEPNSGLIIRTEPCRAILSWYSVIPAKDRRTMPELAQTNGKIPDTLLLKVEETEFDIK